MTHASRGIRRPWALALSGVATLVAVALLSAPACEEAGSTTGAVAVDTVQELVDAYATAEPGAVIELGTGVYESPRLKRPETAPLAEPIVLRAAPDAAGVEVRSLDVAGPSLHVEDLLLTGIVRFRAAAVGSRLEGSTVNPGNVIVEGDGVEIVGNTIQGPPDRDALDIGATDGTGPDGVVVRENLLGPGSLSPGSTAHVDCLQVMSATNLLVVDNLLYDCPAQTLLIKSDLGPIEHARVIRNELRGCTPRTEACPAYMTLQVVPGGHPMRDILLEGNSIAGALRAVAGVESLSIVGNAIDRVEEGCGYDLRNNVVGSSRCELPPGNTLASPAWVDATAEPPDLEPATDSPTVDAGPPTMEADRNGRTSACGQAWDAGAYERCEE